MWNEYEDKEILNVRSISSSEGNYSVVPEISIQSEDELLNGVSPKPVIDDESEREMNSLPCTMVNETDHLTCVNNGNCISLNSVTDNIKSTDSQLQPSSQTRDLDTPEGPLIHDEKLTHKIVLSQDLKLLLRLLKIVLPKKITCIKNVLTVSKMRWIKTIFGVC